MLSASLKTKKYNINMWYVYMLFCDEKTYYVGITTDLKRRMHEHRNKESFFTKKFSHIKPVYCEKYKNQTENSSSKAGIKQMLINGELGINACLEELKDLHRIAEKFLGRMKEFILSKSWACRRRA